MSEILDLLGIVFSQRRERERERERAVNGVVVESMLSIPLKFSHYSLFSFFTPKKEKERSSLPRCIGQLSVFPVIGANIESWYSLAAQVQIITKYISLPSQQTAREKLRCTSSYTATHHAKWNTGLQLHFISTSSSTRTSTPPRQFTSPTLTNWGNPLSQT